jgi:CMP-N-acetylneuraminic acid synthetase
MTTKHYLGVIPARGGSKRIPGKNLALLNGVALIDYTLRAAQGSKRLGAVVVSTDSPAIAGHVRAQGFSVPELRPADMAADRSPVVQALQHAVSAYERAGGAHVEGIVLLQPTSPLRRAQDIDRAIEIFEHADADTVTAVRSVHDHPYWTWREGDGGTIVPFRSMAAVCTDRKDLPAVYVENGAVYVMRRALVDAGSIYGARVAPCVMDDIASLDVDTPVDLAWAEFVLQRGLDRREDDLR